MLLYMVHKSQPKTKGFFGFPLILPSEKEEGLSDEDGSIERKQTCCMGKHADFFGLGKKPGEGRKG